MLSTTKSINLSGISSIEVGGSKKQVVYFNAQIKSDGTYNVNYSVQNDELYKANKDTIKADRDEFETMVESLTE